MMRIIGKIPRKVTIACSGGIDSMVVVDFLLRGKREVQLAYFNHDTNNSHDAEKFVKKYANCNNLNLIIGRVKGVKGKRSFEEFWRDERYGFLTSIRSTYIITCHHLDDCVETWLMSSFRGKSKIIPYKRDDNIYRPFLMTSKSFIRKYAENNKVEWLEDLSNTDTNIVRNHVRHNIIPQVLKINPGIRTTIRKKLLQLYRNI